MSGEPSPGIGARTGRIALLALLGAVVICAIKFVGFAVTNSALLLSDAIESVVNIVASGVMLFAVTIATRPPDARHTYGHGKVEFMAAALEGAFVLAAAFIIAAEAVARLRRPAEVAHLPAGIGIAAFALVLMLILGVVVLRAGRETRSAALTADGVHLLTDALSTLGGIAALGALALTGIARIDAIGSLVMAAVVLLSGWRVLRSSIDNLMDAADSGAMKTVREILDAEVRDRAIHGYHKLRMLRSGRFHWVDMHLQLDGGATVAQAHETASRIEHRIETALGEADATAHVEPSLGARHAASP